MILTSVSVQLLVFFVVCRREDGVIHLTTFDTFVSRRRRVSFFFFIVSFKESEILVQMSDGVQNQLKHRATRTNIIKASF